MNIGSVVPKPSGVSFKDKEFGLPNYLLVGLLVLLLLQRCLDYHAPNPKGFKA